MLCDTKSYGSISTGATVHIMVLVLLVLHIMVLVLLVLHIMVESLFNSDKYVSTAANYSMFT